ncbi:GGDEF domain-containing protein [Eubacterium oxidoreducens]|uniref:Diguanylate cyclase (GGDEF) domain-containing protein n=1 Tax=Eubacterium oxidoreducens TaxID=1732 RepID=A0A1G6C746_EUBOX|nr:GGDEF domain-containing protein [Eubacterium oxidoreducens]SDB28674.1 diguanylate cyclase (GGDEF) domain-containing protein [Eubacterium oxidoreducens]
MGNEKKHSLNSVLYNIIFVVVVLLFIVIGIAVVKGNYIDRVEVESIEYSNGWTTEDGNEMSMNDAWTVWEDGADTYTLSKVLPISYKSESACLNFRSKNCDFKIYIDGDEIYQYEQKGPKIVGKSCGTIFHSVELYDSYKGETITFVVDASYHDDSCFINSLSIEPALTYNIAYMRSHVMEFIIGIAIFIIGVMLIILSVVMKRAKYEPYLTLSLGVLALVLGFWTAIETVFAQMIFGRTALMHYLDFLMLMLLPITSIVFVNAYVLTKRPKLVSIVSFSVLAEMVGLTLTTITGIADYHELLKIIHAVIILAAVFIAWMILKNHKELRERRIRTIEHYGIYLGVIILVGTAIVEIVKYNNSNIQTSDSAHIVRWGAFFFILIVSFSTTAKVMREMRLAKEAETIQKMAYTDALTGMKNRTAYRRDEAEYERQVQSGQIDQIIIAIVDLNNLKTINDTLGHHWGDIAIKKAAEIIEHAVEDKGSAYRIGGDEFAIFLYHPTQSVEEIWKECQKEMRDQEILYNAIPEKEFELSMAYGAVVYDRESSGSLERMEQVADDHMYEMKRKMKEKIRTGIN